MLSSAIAVEKFRGYLLGEEFIVITDHSSLLWLHNLKDPTRRLARWATALQAYNIKIVHRKGALHKVPDALSRAFDEEVDEIAVIGIVDPDGWYSRHFSAVEKEPSKYPDWKIENNLLYKHCINRFVDETVADLDRWMLVIPETDRERVLFECHNPPHAGHLGAEETRFRVAQTYFWPSISKDVAKYVKQCLDCQLHKVSQQAPAGLMGKRDVEGPWLVVASDVMGPFSLSKSQYRYVLVFQDLFTKFVEVRPLRRANA